MINFKLLGHHDPHSTPLDYEGGSWKRKNFKIQYPSSSSANTGGFSSQFDPMMNKKNKDIQEKLIILPVSYAEAQGTELF